LEPVLCWRDLLPEARISIVYHRRPELSCRHHGHALLINEHTCCDEYVYPLNIEHICCDEYVYASNIKHTCCDEHVCTLNIKLSFVVNDARVKSSQYQHDVIWRGRADHNISSLIHAANIFADGAIIVVARNKQRFERKR
jgi:hypothetical protein